MPLGPLAPLPAVTPGRENADESEDQDDQDDRAEAHRVVSMRSPSLTVELLTQRDCLTYVPSPSARTPLPSQRRGCGTSGDGLHRQEQAIVRHQTCIGHRQMLPLRRSVKNTRVVQPTAKF
jgi:hypothetical protein